MSIDAEKMYPSVKFEQIKRAVNYFLRNVPNDEKEIANRCLEMVKYGMDNCFVTYEDQYWIYGGNLPVEEKDLQSTMATKLNVIPQILEPRRNV